MKVRVAEQEVFYLVDKVKSQFHMPRLEMAHIAIEFKDSKPFVRGRFNWGKTRRFAASDKLWQPDVPYDFLISLCDEAWHILAGEQREALIDLHLNCCQVEYHPEMEAINGKEKPAKDKWGRTIYTEEIYYDEDTGEPKWKVIPLDLHVFQDNVVRYGCWCTDLIDLKAAIKQSDSKIPREIVVES